MLKRDYPVSPAHNFERIINLRHEYAAKFWEQETLVQAENFVFIDEEGFLVVTRPKSGRTKKGQTAYTFVSAARSRNIFLSCLLVKMGRAVS